MFRANEAVGGGGFCFISTGTFKQFRRRMLEIINSVFVGNKAGKIGGGIQIVSEANCHCDCHLSISIESSKFEQNFAKASGGAISMEVHNKVDEYTIEKWVFTNNTAGYSGVAINLYETNYQATISQCLLRKNGVTNPGSSGSVIGVFSVEYVFLDSINNTESNCTALHMTKSNVILSGTTFIRDNYAVRSNGGGIHISCGN